MIELLYKSFDRLERELSDISLDDSGIRHILLDGYWRLRQTKFLGSLHGWDNWAWEESRHDTPYWWDLEQSFGKSINLEIIRHTPSIYSIDLIEWASESIINLAIYRLFCEGYTVWPGNTSIKILDHYLPRTIALHISADEGHAQDMLDFLSFSKVDLDTLSSGLDFVVSKFVGIANHYKI